MTVTPCEAISVDKLIEMFIAEPGPVIAMTAIVGGLSIGVLSTLTGAAVAITKTAARERSRRELSAYVAEGSITPDVAERMLEAGRPTKSRSKSSCC